MVHAYRENEPREETQPNRSNMKNKVLTLLASSFVALSSHAEIIWQDADPVSTASDPQGEYIIASGTPDPAGGSGAVGSASYTSDVHGEFRAVSINGGTNGFGSAGSGTYVSAPLGGGYQYADLDASADYGKPFSFSVDVYIPAGSSFGSSSDAVSLNIQWYDSSTTPVSGSPLYTTFPTPSATADLTQRDIWQTLILTGVSTNDLTFTVARVSPRLTFQDASPQVVSNEVFMYVRNIDFRLAADPAPGVVWQDAVPATGVSLVETANGLLIETDSPDPAGGSNPVGCAYYPNPTHVEYRGTYPYPFSSGGEGSPGSGTYLGAPLGSGQVSPGFQPHLNIDSNYYGAPFSFSVEVYIPTSGALGNDANDQLNLSVRWRDNNNNNLASSTSEADLSQRDVWQSVSIRGLCPDTSTLARVSPVLITRDNGVNVPQSNVVYYVRNIDFQLDPSVAPPSIVWQDAAPQTAASVLDGGLTVQTGVADPAGGTNFVGAAFYDQPTHNQFRKLTFNAGNNGFGAEGSGTYVGAPLGGGFLVNHFGAIIDDRYHGRPYTFDAEVYIPTSGELGDDAGDKINMVIRWRDGTGAELATDIPSSGLADLTTRDGWQSLTASGVCPDDANVARVEVVLTFEDVNVNVSQSNIIAYVRNIDFQLDPSGLPPGIVWQDADPATSATQIDSGLVYEAGNTDPAGGGDTVGRAYYTSSFANRSVGVNGGNNSFGSEGSGTYVRAPFGGLYQAATVNSLYGGTPYKFTAEFYIPDTSALGADTNDAVEIRIQWRDNSLVAVETRFGPAADLSLSNTWQTLTMEGISPSDAAIDNVRPVIATEDADANVPLTETIYYVRNISFELGEGTPAPSTPAILAIVDNGDGTVTVTWDTSGTLESASTVDGVYTPVAGATSPSYTTTASGVETYYRVVE